MTRAKCTAKPGPAASVEEPVQVPGPPDETAERRLGRAVVGGTVGNAFTTRLFAGGTFGDSVRTGACLEALQANMAAVQGGDLKSAEAMLLGQAVALDAIFGEMARRAHLNMGQHLEAMEVYARLALRAQGQSRATLETLAAIKNPPVVFTRQMNVTSGPQQVNNGAAPMPAPAQESHLPQNELIEDSTHGRTTLDARATKATGRTSARVAPVGAINRTAKRRGQGEGIAQCVEGWRTAGAAQLGASSWFAEEVPD